MDHRRRQQTDGDGDQGAGDLGRVEEHGADELGGEQPAAEVAERAGEMWRGDGERRRAQRYQTRRKGRRAVDVEHVGDGCPGVVPDRRPEERGNEDADHHAGEHVASEAGASAHDRGEEHDGGPSRRGPHHQQPQRTEELGELAQQVGEPLLEAGAGPRQHAQEDQEHATDDHHRDVGGSARARLARRGGEQHHPEASVVDSGRAGAPHRRGW